MLLAWTSEADRFSLTLAPHRHPHHHRLRHGRAREARAKVPDGAQVRPVALVSQPALSLPTREGRYLDRRRKLTTFALLRAAPLAGSLATRALTGSRARTTEPTPTTASSSACPSQSATLSRRATATSGAGSERSPACRSCTSSADATRLSVFRTEAYVPFLPSTCISHLLSSFGSLPKGRGADSSAS